MSDQNDLENITIPDGVYVRCPLADFQMSPVSACEGCENFHGLLERLRRADSTQEMFETDPNLFRKTFAVRCAWPVDRELFSLSRRPE